MRRTYDTSTAHLLIIAPTGRELGGIRTSRVAGIGVATVGLGRAAADNLRSVLNSRPPQVVLSVGFGGALIPGLTTGDVVVGQHTTSVQLPSKYVPFHFEHSTAVFQALTDAGLSVSYGNVLTVPEPLLTSTEKQSHGLQTQSSIVDMESYWIATECEQMDVPMVSLRVILDEMSHDLPQLVAAITADGGEKEWRHALRAMLKPSSVSALLPLAVRARKAATTIKAAVQAVIPTLTKSAPLRAVYR
jgi:adenosylhomocysteine nucleosidase